MCQENPYIILVESDIAQITWCKKCKSFSLAYMCGCASFTERELRQFHEALNDLQAFDFAYELMGKAHAIIKNPCSPAGFCLTRHHANQLRSYVAESLEIFQAFKVIYDSE